MTTELFAPLSLREVTLRNRLAVSPMCQYSCEDRDGRATDWHLVHLGSRAVGGAGLVMTEATAVEPRGRISPQDLGVWSDAHADALEPVVSFVKARGASAGIQLAHAGRKASTTRPWEGSVPLGPDEGGWETVAPSEIPFPHDAEAPPTRALSTGEIADVTAAFGAAARRARDVGFDVAEIHAAHGYLLHEFLSPVANKRDDEYGGSFENRTRLLREVVRNVRDVWPATKPLFVRISGTDWLDDRPAWDIEQSVRLADRLAADGVDLIDVSSGGMHPDQQLPSTGANYQVPLAERVRTRTESDVAVGTVGTIVEPHQADALVRNERADLVIVGRKHLRDPYFGHQAAEELEATDRLSPPAQYRRGF